MTKRTYGHTKSGRPVDDELIEQLAREAEDGYDVDEIVSRRGKRGELRSEQRVSTPASAGASSGTAQSATRMRFQHDADQISPESFHTEDLRRDERLASLQQQR